MATGKTRNIWLVLAAACLVFCGAQADMRYWTGGGADNKWTTAENWENSTLPGNDDTVVFRPSGELEVSVKKADGSNASQKISGFRFESGTTHLSGGYIYTKPATGEVYVAENAVARIDDTMDAGARQLCLKKTGAGTLNANAVGADYTFGTVILAEGEMTIRGTASKIHRLVICKDTTLTVPNHNTFGNLNPAVVIEKDGLLLATSQGGSLPLKSLEGEGTIDTSSGNSSGVTLKLTPTEDVVFKGSIGLRMWTTINVNSTGRFILGSSDVLANTFEVHGSRWLGFAPGVGTFKVATTYFYPDEGYPLDLRDTDGNPVTVQVAIPPSQSGIFRTTGPGDIYAAGLNVTLTGACVASTGILGAKQNTLTLGNGTAGCDFDFSTISGIDAAGGTIDICNAGPFVFDGVVKGYSLLKLHEPAVLSNLSMNSGRLAVYDDLAVTGGDSTLSTDAAGLILASAGKTVAVTNATLHGPVLVDANQGIAHLPTPWGTILSGEQPDTKIIIGPGADFYVNYQTTSGVQTLVQDAGSIHFCGPYPPFSGSTAGNPSKILFNGGTAWMVTCKNYAAVAMSPFANTDALQVKVGEQGVVFRTEGVLNRNEGAMVKIERPLLSGVDGGIDGGLRQYGYPEYRYEQPIGLTGPFFAEGGVSIAKGSLADAPYWFGTGALSLRNHMLEVAKQSAAATLQLSSLAVEGGAYLLLRGDSSGAKVDANIGSLSVAQGSALFLGDVVGEIGSDGASSVKVAGGVATAANGRVLAPVFGTKAVTSQYFLGYDVEKGFVPLTGIVEASHLGNADRSKVVTLLQNSYGMDQVAKNQTVAAESLMLEKPGVYLRLLENAKLLMGDGVNQSVLLLNNSTVEGRTGAYLDFGDSEGLIVTAGANFPSIASTLNIDVKGTKGVSYTAKPYLNYNCFHAVRVGGTNTYSGVTHIGAVCVYANGAQCFSSGDVYVSGGERFGGHVRFNCDGGVWNNNFHIAGRGVKETLLSGNRNCGAMSFNRNGTVAGGVEIVDFAQICATGGFRGTLSGTVSGGRMRVLGKDGVIALTGSNTYTGGTEVVEAVIALGRGDSAGTGEIELNGGILRFINDQPVVFTNAVAGVGTIEVSGTAPVTFKGDAFAALPLATLAPGSSFSFPALDAATIVAAVTVEGLDLGGKALTVDGLYGAGTVRGGILTVTGAINPGGAGRIGTIVFETMPVLDGATLVTEVSATGIDGIELPGDFDCSVLALEVVDMGCTGVRLVAPVVSCAGGVRTGEFSTVTLPAKRPRRFELSYGTSAAVLSVGSGSLILLR